MKRSEAREQAFKLLYSLQLIEDKDIEEQLNLFLEENKIVDKNAIEYIKDVITGTNKNNNEIEKQKIIERGYTEGTYQNLDGYTIVMKNQEDGNFEKIENIFDVEIYYPNGEILCEESGMQLNTYTANLEGYQCDIKQVSEGELNLLLSSGLMYQMGLDPRTDEPVIEGCSVINELKYVSKIAR